MVLAFPPRLHTPPDIMRTEESERLALPFPLRSVPMQQVAKTLHRCHQVPAHQKLSNAMTRAGLDQAEEQKVLFFLSGGNIMVSGVHSFPFSFFLWLTLTCYSRPSSGILSSWVSALHAYSKNPRPPVGAQVTLCLSPSECSFHCVLDMSSPLGCEDGVQVFFTCHPDVAFYKLFVR